MLPKTTPAPNIAEAMWNTGIADDRNNPMGPKPITPNSLAVLNRRYLLKNPDGTITETPQGMFKRVSENLAQADSNYISDDQENESSGLRHRTIATTQIEFENIMSRLLCLPNSPTLMNAGATLQQLAACFVLPVEDSLDAIFEGVKQTALIHKSGGGTGFSFSRLRPKGDLVGSTGGVASGPVGFIRAYDVATDVVKQGGTRRGANMAVLRIDHPDIEEFIHSKDTSELLQNFNISVAVTDEFMEALDRNGSYKLINPRTQEVTKEIPAQAIWDQIVASAHLTGDPGVIFIDTINRHNVNPHLGDIEAVNPCVTGETLVYSREGLYTIEELWAKRADPMIAVDGRFNVNRFQQASAVMATGVRTVYRLNTEQGYGLRLTADHRVMTTQGWKEAQQLVPGDEIHILNRKGGFGSQGDHSTGVLLAWLSAGNALHPDDNTLPFLRDLHLPPEFPGATKEAFLGRQPSEEASVALLTKHATRNQRLHHHLIEAAAEYGLTPETAHEVPRIVLQGTEPTQRGYLQTLFTAGGIQQDGENEAAIHLQLGSEHHAAQVQQLLLNFNVISTRQPTGDNDRKTVTICAASMRIFAHQIGYINERKDRELKNQVSKFGKNNHAQGSFTATFKNLTEDGEEQVYDISEPLTNSFIAGGLVVHNCGEQVLRPNEACNLASINLARMVKYDTETHEASIDYKLLEDVCKTTVHMLDNVIDMNNYPNAEISETTRSTRRIGVGVMGFADMLIQLGIPYDSEQARRLAANVMAFIQTTSQRASTALAESRDSYPLWDGSAYSRENRPMRNTAPVTIAPTGTISIIAGASSGIEPLFALCFTRNVMDGTKLTEVNPYFETTAKYHGFYSPELMEQIAFSGSVQNCNVPQWVKDVFKTAADIRPEDHVRMQAAFQEHTDNAVSKTINFPAEASPEDINTAYRLAHKLGCKGITVYRDGSKENQVLSTGSTHHAGQATDSLTPTNGRQPTAARPRPRTMAGITERYRTGHGNLYVTINLEDGEPFEIFARVGKAGGCDSAQQEAICRLISMALRADINPTEIINNLRGITCCPHWDEGRQILSVPDGLAQSLSSILSNLEPLKFATEGRTTTQMALLEESYPQANEAALRRQEYRSGPSHCPECDSRLAFEEGCYKCLNFDCGWFKC